MQIVMSLMQVGSTEYHSSPSTGVTLSSLTTKNRTGYCECLNMSRSNSSLLFVITKLRTHHCLLSILFSNKGPSTSVRVEATPDAYGLHVGVGFRMDGNQVNFRLYKCANGATLRITSLDEYGNVGASGCQALDTRSISIDSGESKGIMDASGWILSTATEVVASAALQTAPTNLGDWTVCDNSNQCTNQCCSSKYSEGVLKCTPVGGFKTWEGCVGSTTVATKQGDWTVCNNSNQCTNQCCSSKYSEGVLKCTPVGGFKTWEGCVGSATRNLRGNNADDREADELAWGYSDAAVMVEDAFGEELN